MSATPDMSALLDSLYRTTSRGASLEKTAEESLLSALRETEEAAPAGPPDYSKMSTADLIALAQTLETPPAEKVAAAAKPADPVVEKTAAEKEAEASAELEKTAGEMLGGQIMAHAMTHEFAMIKVAMSNGLCRVCKEKPMDVEGSSICAECAAS